MEGLKPCTYRHVDDGGRILCGLIKGSDREVSVNLCRACPVPQINCQNLRATMMKKVATPITVKYATGRVEVWDNEPPTIDFKQAACVAKTMPIHSPRDCVGCPLRVPVVIPQNAIQVARQLRAQVEPAAVTKPKGIPVPTIEEIPAQPAIAQPAAQSNVGVNLVQRAEQIANKKAREAGQGQRARVVAAHTQGVKAETPEVAAGAHSENKPKIILLQEWLASQFNKKQQSAPAAAQADESGVQEIVYERLAPTYNEEAGWERCVGWTD